MKTLETVTRYAITCINRDGMRQIANSNQGRYFRNSQAEMQDVLDIMLKNNSRDTMDSFYGPQSRGTFRVDPIACYQNGDAVGIYIDDPKSPFSLKYDL